jgi:hypothetical protein
MLRRCWIREFHLVANAMLAIFPNAYMFRLAVLRPMHSEVSKTRWTRIGHTLFRPLLPLMRAIVPGAVITTEEMGRAIIGAARVRPSVCWRIET